MNKIYFVSYYMRGYSQSYKVGCNGDWSRIEQDIIKEHPLNWIKKKNADIEVFRKLNPNDAHGSTTYSIIWWKELTDEEIQELDI
ncbi:MAG: hypothetical protein ACFFKA_16605 [Candidatus Thorarchaeota archaeon]